MLSPSEDTPEMSGGSTGLEAGAGGSVIGIRGRKGGIEGKMRDNRGEQETIGESRRQSKRWENK